MIFQVRPLLRQSVFQKIFRQHPQENAVIELNNLLASTPLEKLTRLDVEQIEAKYKLALKVAFTLNVEEFYLVFLNYCLEHENDFSVSTSPSLAHLRHLLDIENNLAQDLAHKLASHLYRAQFRQRMTSQTNADDRESALEKLSRAMDMDEGIVKKIRSDEFELYLKEAFKKIISKNRFSSSEEEHLATLGEKLKISVKTDQETKLKLDRAKKLWRLENLALPEVNAQIPLQKNENCYYHSPSVNWHEYRSDRGVRTPRLLHHGQIYVTNKRIIFDSAEKSTTIKLGSILGVHAYENCLEIRKDKGRSPLLETDDLESFSIVVRRILRSQF